MCHVFSLKIKSLCQGCQSRNIFDCIPRGLSGNPCPCSECMVKPICSNYKRSGCGIYKSYLNRIKVYVELEVITQFKTKHRCVLISHSDSYEANPFLLENTFRLEDWYSNKIHTAQFVHGVNVHGSPKYHMDSLEDEMDLWDCEAVFRAVDVIEDDINEGLMRYL